MSDYEITPEIAATIDDIRYGCQPHEAIGRALVAFLRQSKRPAAFVSPSTLLTLARTSGQPVQEQGGHVLVRLYTVAGMVSVYEDLALGEHEVRFRDPPLIEPSLADRVALLEQRLALAEVRS